MNIEKARQLARLEMNTLINDIKPTWCWFEKFLCRHFYIQLICMEKEVMWILTTQSC